MTTVIATRKGMAADKRGTGTAIFKLTKAFRVNGNLIGFCGNVENGLRFIDWRRSLGTRPEFSTDTDFEAIEVSPEGLIYWGSELTPVAIEDDFYAIGTGAQFALGALAMGASIHKAIQIAHRWDENTGPDVQILYLRKGK